jgi:TPR repeat protein
MLFACVWLFALAGQSSADTLSDALRAFDEGRHATAAKLFKPLADKGNSIAQFKLATMYYSGKGVPKNIKEALRLYRLSAEQGHVVAQSNLATMYYLGEGVSRDFVLAHMWKNIAATNSEGDRQLRYFEQLKTLANDMTAKQIAEAQALAKKCTSNRFKGCKR